MTTVVCVCVVGMQMMNKEFGGSVDRHDMREDGQFDIDVDTDSILFKGLSERESVLLTHGDSVSKVADGFTASAHSGRIISGITLPKVKI